MMKLLSLILSVLIVGCSSIEPVTNPSRAYTIANETYLTKDYSLYFKTYHCKLKDYSLEDLEQLKRATTKSSSAGDVAIAIGVFSILTGNFTGVIDVAGGTAANIANSEHRTARSLWFAAIPANEVENGLEATNLARKTIQNEAIKILEEHGVKLEKIITKSEREATFGAKLYQETAYKAVKTGAIYGFNLNEFYLQRENLAMVLGNTSFIDAQKQYVSSPETMYYGLNFFNKKYLIDNKISPFDTENGFEIFMLELTSRLPDGYFYYESPRSSRNLIPAVYMKGVKYQFIHPDIEKDLNREAL